MIMLDQTVVTVALPAMSDDLGLRPAGQQWVVNAYVLALTALVAFGGKLGDRVGGVRTFRLGVAGFFVASALCGLAPGRRAGGGVDRGRPRAAGCGGCADGADLRGHRHLGLSRAGARAARWPPMPASARSSSPSDR